MKSIMKQAVVAFVLLLALSGCGQATITSEVNEDNAIGKVYQNLSESEEKSITVGEGESMTVIFEIVTDGGAIDVSLVKDGDTYYTGNDVPTNDAFTVTLDEPGEYMLKINTSNHSGSYDIRWS